MKPLDFSKPVQTRNGRKVRILCTDMKGRDDSIVGIVTDCNGEEYSASWQKGGFFHSTSDHAPGDLINVPETRVVWVNMYPDNYGSLHQSKTSADKMLAKNSRAACIRVEYTVGQFDE